MKGPFDDLARGVKIDLSKKSVCVVDRGWFSEFAVRLARDFGKVYYHNASWKSAFPPSNFAKVCAGIDNIEFALDAQLLEGKVDLWAFPDIYDGDWQQRLREAGMAVFGNGMAEALELDRWAFKERLAKAGLPVPKSARIVGLDKLRAAMEKSDDFWVKRPRFRGDGETFHHEGLWLSEPWLQHQAERLGPFADEAEYIAEEGIKGQEVGVDWFTVLGEYPSKGSYGYEDKGTSYFGRFVDRGQMPAPLEMINEGMAPWLRELGAQGLISFEIRVNDPARPYLIDPCIRAPNPPVGLYMEGFKNFSEIVWFAGHGIVLDPEMEFEYGAELMLWSEWAMENWSPFKIPDAIRPWVKLRSVAKKNGLYFNVPLGHKASGVGSVIALGNSLDDCEGLIKERVEQLKGYGLDYKLDSFNDVRKFIEEGKAVGITWK
jgi:hypothetical protein